jgi:hypothetical protein
MPFRDVDRARSICSEIRATKLQLQLQWRAKRVRRPIPWRGGRIDPKRGFRGRCTYTNEQAEDQSRDLDRAYQVKEARHGELTLTQQPKWPSSQLLPLPK